MGEGEPVLRHRRGALWRYLVGYTGDKNDDFGRFIWDAKRGYKSVTGCDVNRGTNERDYSFLIKAGNLNNSVAWKLGRLWGFCPGA